MIVRLRSIIVTIDCLYNSLRAKTKRFTFTCVDLRVTCFGSCYYVSLYYTYIINKKKLSRTVYRATLA